MITAIQKTPPPSPAATIRKGGGSFIVARLTTHVTKLPIVVVNRPLGEPPDLALQQVFHDCIL